MDTILGTADYKLFFSLYFFGVIGLIISLLLNAAHRNPVAPTTPLKFHVWFMIVDNYKRIVLSFLLIFVVVRFYNEIFNEPISPWLSLLAGLGLDKISQYLKTKVGALQIDRDDVVQNFTPKTDEANVSKTRHETDA